MDMLNELVVNKNCSQFFHYRVPTLRYFLLLRLTSSTERVETQKSIWAKIYFQHEKHSFRHPCAAGQIQIYQ